MNCEACGAQNLDTAVRCIRCGGDLLSPYKLSTTSAARPLFTLKRAIFFVAVWVLLAGEIVLYSGSVPMTARGWALLIVLGPICYVLFYWVLDSVIPRKK